MPNQRCYCLPGPRYILNIIICELAERFSFYGSRALLPLYLHDNLGLSSANTISLISFFTAACYLSPLVGGFLADSKWGRYKTILRFGILYIIGSGILSTSAFLQSSLDDTRIAVGIMYLGLACIAMATGGVKASVASFGADQFTITTMDSEATKKPTITNTTTTTDTSTNDQAVTSFFLVFYACINIGSLLSYLTVPLLRQAFGYGPAFSLLTSGLAFSMLVFVCAGGSYTKIPPQGSILVRAFYVIQIAWKEKRNKSSVLYNNDSRMNTNDIINTSIEENQPLMRSLPNSTSSMIELCSPSSHAPSILKTQHSVENHNGNYNNTTEDTIIGNDKYEQSSNTNTKVESTIISSPSSLSQSHQSSSTTTLTTTSNTLGSSATANTLPVSLSWLGKAALASGGKVSLNDVIDVEAVLNILPIFAMLPFFWAIYDSYSAVWTLQAKKMNLCFKDKAFCLQPETLQIVNPSLIVLFIPLFDRLIRYLYTSKYTWIHPSPLKRMILGMYLIGFAWIYCGVLETIINQNSTESVSVVWQLPQYLILTISEICVSTTGVEFAYRQAPVSSKGLVLSCWYLATSLGDVMNGAIYGALGEVLAPVQLIWVSTVLMFIAAISFNVIALRFKPK